MVYLIIYRRWLYPWRNHTIVYTVHVGGSDIEKRHWTLPVFLILGYPVHPGFSSFPCSKQYQLSKLEFSVWKATVWRCHLIFLFFSLLFSHIFSSLPQEQKFIEGAYQEGAQLFNYLFIIWFVFLFYLVIHSITNLFCPKYTSNVIPDLVTTSSWYNCHLLALSNKISTVYPHTATDQAITIQHMYKLDKLFLYIALKFLMADW